MVVVVLPEGRDVAEMNSPISTIFLSMELNISEHSNVFCFKKVTGTCTCIQIHAQGEHLIMTITLKKEKKL